jgi:hypothetical protein
LHKATISDDLEDVVENNNQKRGKSSTNPEDLRGLSTSDKPKRGKIKPDRNKRYRKRLRDAKKSKGDRLRCYQVWMTDTEVIALLRDVEMAQQRDDQSSITPREVARSVDKQWVEVTGRVIGQAARSTIRK